MNPVGIPPQRTIYFKATTAPDQKNTTPEKIISDKGDTFILREGNGASKFEPGWAIGEGGSGNKFEPVWAIGEGCKE